MRSRATLALGLVALGGLAAAGEAERPYGVGRMATAEEVRRRDVTVLPTGTGLPEGQGTAREGRPLYGARCAPCHGVKGEGTDDYPPLAGGRGSLTTDKPLLTVGSYWPYATTAFDYIRRAMPYDDPGTLSPNELYAVTAYVLHLNGLVAEGDVLDRQSLPAVRMPNREGFVRDARPDVGASAAPPSPAGSAGSGAGDGTLER
jgi:S-disulfanyl-L-cysteine oxidoreductase SoxD